MQATRPETRRDLDRWVEPVKVDDSRILHKGKRVHIKEINHACRVDRSFIK